MKEAARAARAAEAAEAAAATAGTLVGPGNSTKTATCGTVCRAAFPTSTQLKIAPCAARCGACATFAMARARPVKRLPRVFPIAKETILERLFCERPAGLRPVKRFPIAKETIPERLFCKRPAGLRAKLRSTHVETQMHAEELRHPPLPPLQQDKSGLDVFPAWLRALPTDRRRKAARHFPQRPNTARHNHQRHPFRPCVFARLRRPNRQKCP